MWMTFARSWCVLSVHIGSSEGAVGTLRWFQLRWSVTVRCLEVPSHDFSWSECVAIWFRVRTSETECGTHDIFNLDQPIIKTQFDIFGFDKNASQFILSYQVKLCCQET